jgi:hypothetical protein
MLDEPEAHEKPVGLNDHLAGPTSIPNLGGYVVWVIVEAADAGSGTATSATKADRSRRTAIRKNGLSFPSPYVLDSTTVSTRVVIPLLPTSVTGP